MWATKKSAQTTAGENSQKRCCVFRQEQYKTHVASYVHLTGRKSRKAISWPLVFLETLSFFAPDFLYTFNDDTIMVLTWYLNRHNNLPSSAGNTRRFKRDEECYTSNDVAGFVLMSLVTKLVKICGKTVMWPAGVGWFNWRKGRVIMSNAQESWPHQKSSFVSAYRICL